MSGAAEPALRPRIGGIETLTALRPAWCQWLGHRHPTLSPQLFLQLLLTERQHSRRFHPAKPQLLKLQLPRELLSCHLQLFLADQHLQFLMLQLLAAHWSS